MERNRRSGEMLSLTGLFSPREYFRKGKLFSSQIGATNQESVMRAFDEEERFAKIMEDPSGNIIVFDGHHSVAYSILENSSVGYEKIPYKNTIRITPFSVFYSNFKRLLPREY